MSDIAEFLRARYAEMRTLAEEARDGNWDFQPYAPLAPGDDPVKYEAVIARVRLIEALQPDHTLADLDAKLATVAHMVGVLAYAEGDTEVDHYDALGTAETVLCHLAAPFAAHPDYDERWRP